MIDWVVFEQLRGFGVFTETATVMEKPGHVDTQQKVARESPVV